MRILRIMTENTSQIMMKIANKEYCCINANEMGMKYVSFSLSLSISNICIIIDTYKKNMNICVDF